MGINIQVALGIGKLLHLRGGDGIRSWTGREIEAGAADRQSLAGLGIADAELRDALHPGAAAQILHEKQWQPIWACGIDRGNREAMAMGEDQMLVQPGARSLWQGLAIQFPGRDEHLLAGVPG